MKPRVFGLETEYGVMLEKEGILVRIEPRFLKMLLKSRGVLDAERGFRPNGGNVHACSNFHPEYATAECKSLLDLVAQDKAGERILSSLLPELGLFKDNADSWGVYFGCHENYSISHPFKRYHYSEYSGYARHDLHFKRYILNLAPFFITRQIFTGAGRIVRGEYHLSQREAYVGEIIKKHSEYSEKRSLFPHFVGHVHRRNREDGPYDCLELRIGESNMSEVATYLKTGLTCLMLDLAEDGKLPNIRLVNHTAAFIDISADQSRKWFVDAYINERRKMVSAVEIQRRYFDRAHRYYAGRDPITDECLGKWLLILENIQRDPLALRGMIDWINKECMLNELRQAEGLKLNHKLVKSVALEYHNIDPNKGLFYAGQNAGLSERAITEADIAKAMMAPPEDTRAFFRGKMIEKYGADKDGLDVDWGHVRVPKEDIFVKIPNPSRSYKELLSQFN